MNRRWRVLAAMALLLVSMTAPFSGIGSGQSSGPSIVVNGQSSRLTFLYPGPSKVQVFGTGFTPSRTVYAYLYADANCSVMPTKVDSFINRPSGGFGTMEPILHQPGSTSIRFMDWATLTYSNCVEITLVDQSSPPTSTDTATATQSPMASTNIPLATPIVDLPTDTPGATEPIEPTQPTTGNAAITLVSPDGGPIPDDTEVCVADQCEDDPSSSTSGVRALPSGSTFVFTGLPLGTQRVRIDTGGAVVLTANIEILPGTTDSLTLIDPIAAGSQPTSAPIDGRGSPAQPTAATVTTLPNTGSGSTNTAPYLVPALAALIVLALALLAFRRREG